MQVLKKKLAFGKKKKIAEIIYGACWHLGNPSCSEEGVARFMEDAKKKAGWWHAGDATESIPKDDSRNQAGEHTETVLATSATAADYLSKSRGNCWGFICGNHEYGGSRNIGSIAEDIARRAKIPYLGMTTYFDIQCPKGSSLVFAAHGSGSMGFNSGFPERDRLNRELKLRRILKPFNADLKCIAHYHKTILARRLLQYQGTVENGLFKRRACVEVEEWCAACPSLFMNYHEESNGSYAEMKLYPPTDIGWIGIVYNRDGTIACLREYSAKGNITQEVEEQVVR